MYSGDGQVEAAFAQDGLTAGADQPGKYALTGHSEASAAEWELQHEHAEESASASTDARGYSTALLRSLVSSELIRTRKLPFNLRVSEYSDELSFGGFRANELS